MLEKSAEKKTKQNGQNEAERKDEENGKEKG